MSGRQGITSPRRNEPNEDKINNTPSRVLWIAVALLVAGPLAQFSGTMPPLPYRTLNRAYRVFLHRLRGFRLVSPVIYVFACIYGLYVRPYDSLSLLHISTRISLFPLFYSLPNILYIY